MEMFQKKSIVTIIVAFFVFGLVGFISPNTAQAASAPGLGVAAGYSVFGNAGITETPAQTSHLWGNAGGNGLGNASLIASQVAGSIDAGANVPVVGAISSAYGDLAQPITGTIDLATSPTVGPGVYDVSAGNVFTSTLTLNGSGVYIFRSTSNIAQAAGGTMILTGGACASDVFWQVQTAMTFAAAGNIQGTIIANTLISFVSGVNLKGRAWAGTQVTMSNNQITAPVCNATLTLNKIMDNTGGGVELPAAWTLSTVAPSPTIISGHTTDVAVTNAAVLTGAYTLSEDGPAGYTAGTYSCVKNGGGAVVSNSISLAAGDNAVCTITNTYIPPVPVAPILHLVKVIVGGSAHFADFILTANGTGANDFSGPGPVNSPPGLLADTFALSETNPGSYTASAWSCVKNLGAPVSGASITLVNGDEATCTITNTFVPSGGGSFSPVVPPLIDVVKVPSPLSLPAGSGLVNYTYTLKNIGTVPVTNITMVDDSCSPVTLTSGDTNADSKLDLTETWIYHCSKTLSATHTNIVTATGWANGVSATDIATATVVVGQSVVPPLIHITKVPNPLTLGAGGGMVTYTKKVTNPGTVALSNVHVTDSKCSPINYISGDTNSNSMLEPSETWTYTCQTNLTQTTTNTAIATGTANGLTATDFAIATVVVAGTVAYTIPTLPNTGVIPMGSILLWSVIAIVVFFLSTYFIRKKQTK
ncbi:MAG: ice-binding family protein [Patescibacteria group bacterium]|nr:ice-binding family protein [Patescibacteria group bacterium]